MSSDATEDGTQETSLLYDPEKKRKSSIYGSMRAQISGADHIAFGREVDGAKHHV